MVLGSARPSLCTTFSIGAGEAARSSPPTAVSTGIRSQTVGAVPVSSVRGTCPLTDSTSGPCTTRSGSRTSGACMDAPCRANSVTGPFVGLVCPFFPGGANIRRIWGTRRPLMAVPGAGPPSSPSQDGPSPWDRPLSSRRPKSASLSSSGSSVTPGALSSRAGPMSSASGWPAALARARPPERARAAARAGLRPETSRSRRSKSRWGS